MSGSLSVLSEYLAALCGGLSVTHVGSGCDHISLVQVGSHRVRMSRGFEANAPAFDR